VAFAAATALASALYWTGRVVPVVGRNLHACIAVIFLYVPALAARISHRPFDYRDAGLRADPVVLNLKVLGAALAVTWPVFAIGFFLYYGFVCGPDTGALTRLLGQICGSWRGFDRGAFELPESFALLAAVQLVVIAVPEELFFRGYLMGRLEERWPSSRRVAGALVGRALVVSSLLFAVGHVLVDFNPQRFSVFFPALVFGWMRARTGSIAAGAAYHALCNLFSDVLHISFF